MPSQSVEQYTELIQYLSMHGSAKVTDIAKSLFLSESTVRRALSFLEQYKILKRYHGGAVLLDAAAFTPIKRRKVTREAEKEAIGRMAASFVKNGMTLLLMGGTTVHAMCPYLHNMRLTVITSSLPVMNDLAWEENIKVILLGGVLNPAEMEVRGGLMHLALERLRADIMLTGTTGLHPIHGLMTDDPNGIETYKACMRISDQLIVLADHTKCDHYEGTTVLCSLDKIDILITDSGMKPADQAYYQKQIKKLYVTDVPGTSA